MVILHVGVTIADRVKVEGHIDKAFCHARQSMLALRAVITHGLHGPCLFDDV